MCALVSTWMCCAWCKSHTCLKTSQKHDVCCVSSDLTRNKFWRDEEVHKIKSQLFSWSVKLNLVNVMHWCRLGGYQTTVGAAMTWLCYFNLLRHNLPSNNFSILKHKIHLWQFHCEKKNHHVNNREKLHLISWQVMIHFSFAVNSSSCFTISHLHISMLTVLLSG